MVYMTQLQAAWTELCEFDNIFLCETQWFKNYSDNLLK